MKCKIPCDYKEGYNGGKHLEDGRYLVYGEMGGCLPYVINCPKCNNTKWISVDETFILDQIKEIELDIQELKEELLDWQSYLLNKGN